MSKATEKLDASLRHVSENELKQGWVGETEEKRKAEGENNLPQKSNYIVNMANYSCTDNVY